MLLMLLLLLNQADSVRYPSTNPDCIDPYTTVA